MRSDGKKHIKKRSEADSVRSFDALETPVLEGGERDEDGEDGGERAVRGARGGACGALLLAEDGACGRLEALGGGGSRSSAAVQLHDVSVAQAVQMARKAIDENLEN